MKNNETKEIWVSCKYIKNDSAVIDFAGYEVSNLGRVKSLNYRGTGKVRELKQGVHEASDGAIYYNVILYKDNKKYSILVHRLVLSSFDPKGFKPGKIVNHKVERTATSCINELSNLEWTTQKANINTEHCRTLQSKAHTNHPTKSKRVRVTFPDQKQQIFPSAKEAGRSLGISPWTPSHCIINSKGYYKKRQLHFEYVL